MPSNLENSAVPTGLEKVSFHSNPKFIHYFWQLIFSLQLSRYSNGDFLTLYFYKDFPKDYLFIPFPVCMCLILYIHIYALMISAQALASFSVWLLCPFDMLSSFLVFYLFSIISVFQPYLNFPLSPQLSPRRKLLETNKRMLMLLDASVSSMCAYIYTQCMYIHTHTHTQTSNISNSDSGDQNSF